MRILLLCTLLLSACVPRPPALPYADAPAGPLVRSLEEQRAAFASLKTLARVQTERAGRRRVYESVAIVQQGFDRLRVEGYGPLGEVLFSLVWDGAARTVLLSDGTGVRTLGEAGLERIMGISLPPGDLCALLAGSSPRLSGAALTEAGCSPDGRCAVDLIDGSARWRVHGQRSSGASDGGFRIASVERYQGGSLVLIARYEGAAGDGGYPLPARVVVQNPDRRVTLTIDYLDAEVNVPLDSGAFSMTGSAP